MTKITDEAGHALVRNWCEPGLVRRQEFGNGEIYSYDYIWPPKAYYPSKVTVTRPDRSMHELSVGEFVPEYVRNYERQAGTKSK